MPRVLDPFRFVLIAVAGWMNQRHLQITDYLREENRVLREQLGARRVRLNSDQRPSIGTIVTPETLLACHRKLIAQKYDSSGQQGPEGPCTAREIEASVVRMAEENRDWDYRLDTGCVVQSRATSLPPARSLRFWDGTESSRRQSGVGRRPVLADFCWMSQIGRNLTDAVDGILTGKRYLIHGRDRLFTTELLNPLAATGLKSVRLPPQSPNLNAYTERFVGTIKESCLERMIRLERSPCGQPFATSSLIITLSAITRGSEIG